MNAKHPVEENAPKRGRKPLGDTPLTHAERQRRYRARSAADGYAEFMVRIKGGTLNFIDQFATAGNVSRSRVIEEFLDMAIARLGIAVSEAENMMASGATEKDVASCLHQRLQTVPEPRLIGKYKEVLGIK